MTDLLTTEAITAFFQVVMIDLILAGDNAIVIGLAAAGLPQEQRTKAILVGIVAATALRILFAGVTTQLLKLVGLLFAGGLLLLWVCWKMWRELRTSRNSVAAPVLPPRGRPSRDSAAQFSSTRGACRGRGRKIRLFQLAVAVAVAIAIDFT